MNNLSSFNTNHRKNELTNTTKNNSNVIDHSQRKRIGVSENKRIQDIKQNEAEKYQEIKSITPNNLQIPINNQIWEPDEPYKGPFPDFTQPKNNTAIQTYRMKDYKLIFVTGLKGDKGDSIRHLITNPAEGEHLIYDYASGLFKNKFVEYKINELFDVNIDPDPLHGEMLTYNDDEKKWRNYKKKFYPVPSDGLMNADSINKIYYYDSDDDKIFEIFYNMVTRIGSVIEIFNIGRGILTIKSNNESGVLDIISDNNNLNCGRYSKLTLIKPNTWVFHTTKDNLKQYNTEKLLISQNVVNYMLLQTSCSCFVNEDLSVLIYSYIQRGGLQNLLIYDLKNKIFVVNIPLSYLPFSTKIYQLNPNKHIIGQFGNNNNYLLSFIDNFNIPPNNFTTAIPGNSIIPFNFFLEKDFITIPYLNTSGILYYYILSSLTWIPPFTENIIINPLSNVFTDSVSIICGWHKNHSCILTVSDSELFIFVNQDNNTILSNNMIFSSHLISIEKITFIENEDKNGKLYFLISKENKIFICGLCDSLNKYFIYTSMPTESKFLFQPGIISDEYIYILFHDTIYGNIKGPSIIRVNTKKNKIKINFNSLRINDNNPNNDNNSYSSSICKTNTGIFHMGSKANVNNGFIYIYNQ